MKFTNSISILFMAMVLSLFIVQCSNDEGLFEENIEDPILYSSLEDLQFELLQNDTIKFEIPTDETDTTFLTPGGIRLIFPPNSIIPGGGGGTGGGTGGGGGTPVPPYTVHIIEVFKRGDFVRNYLQTYEDEFPLVSGGAFLVQVRDANGGLVGYENVQAYIPYKTDANSYQNDMSAFKVDYMPILAGSINNWVEAIIPITYDPSAGPTGEFYHPNIVLGWNHIGNQLNITEPTQFTVNVTNAPDYFDTRVFFVLDDFTVIAGIYTPSANQLTTLLASIPKNATGKLVAISLIEDQLYFTSQEVTINGDDHFDLTVAPGTIEDLNALLDTMN